MFLYTISVFCLLLIFILSTFQKITNFSSTQKSISITILYSISRNKLLATFLTSIAICLELFGILYIVYGIITNNNFIRWVGKLLLLSFLIIATLFYHNPFDSSQRIHFLKNLAILGGILLI